MMTAAALIPSSPLMESLPSPPKLAARAHPQHQAVVVIAGDYELAAGIPSASAVSL